MTFEEIKKEKNLDALKGMILETTLYWAHHQPEILPSFVFKLLKYLDDFEELSTFYEKEVLEGPNLEDDITNYVKYNNALGGTQVTEEEVKVRVFTPVTEKVQ